jgi:predicted NAD/FAD-binding protein
MGRSVAIVGAGVAGLTAAAELHRAGHRVTVFEAGAHAGGHTHTHTVPLADGSSWQVDTGFIVMNDRNYPNFTRVLEELGVATQATNMSFGVSDDAGSFEWAARGLRGIFAQRRHAVDPRFLRMLVDIARFNRRARRLTGHRGSGPSLRAFLEAHDFSDYFIERLLVPQAASIWSADPAQMWSFPAAFLAEFFENHGTLQMLRRPQWLTVAGGSDSYVRALSAPFAERLRLRTPVDRIERGGDGVRIDSRAGRERFDDVVIATHSDQALRMLADPSDAEREILGAIPYRENETVLHTDAALMPRRKAAWASWNFHLTGDGERTTLTYDMNRLQRLDAPVPFLVTLNRTEAIDPTKVHRVINYSHPVFTNEGMRAQERWREISGADRTHYCGAYWRWGFHEDGCWSGLRVSEALGGRGPGLGGVVPAAVGRSPAEGLLPDFDEAGSGVGRGGELVPEPA